MSVVPVAERLFRVRPGAGDASEPRPSQAADVSWAYRPLLFAKLHGLIVAPSVRERENRDGFVPRSTSTSYLPVANHLSGEVAARRYRPSRAKPCALPRDFAAFRVIPGPVPPARRTAASPPLDSAFGPAPAPQPVLSLFAPKVSALSGPPQESPIVRKTLCAPTLRKPPFAPLSAVAELQCRLEVIPLAEATGVPLDSDLADDRRVDGRGGVLPPVDHRPRSSICLIMSPAFMNWPRTTRFVIPGHGQRSSRLSETSCFALPPSATMTIRRGMK